jgi:8-oxo-dGTP pyrophosphatase MutT (NUDIX family)
MLHTAPRECTPATEVAVKAKNWTKIGEAVVLAKGFGKRLYKQVFRNPYTGEEAEFIQFSQPDWSVVLPITSDGCVLAVSEFKQGRDAIGIELPAGTGSSKSKPEDIGARELEEETGYRAARYISLGSMWMSTRNSPTKAHCFLALGCTKVSDGMLDTNEVIDVLKFPLKEWVQKVIEGKIEEPSAVVATVRALPHLAQFGVQLHTQKACGLAKLFSR